MRLPHLTTQIMQEAKGHGVGSVWKSIFLPKYPNEYGEETGHMTQLDVVVVPYAIA